MRSWQRKSLACLVLILLLPVSLAVAQQQQPPSYSSTSPASSTPDTGASVFKTFDAVVVAADAEEKILYLTNLEGEAKMKVLLDEKTKIKIQKQKGRLEMLPSLDEGMKVSVTVNMSTGVAVSVKTKKEKKG